MSERVRRRLSWLPTLRSDDVVLLYAFQVRYYE